MERPTSTLRLPAGTLATALCGSVLCYLAHPPVGLSALAWIGPVPWIALVRRPQLSGRRPYRALWLAGFLYWLLTVAWIRLPHPANHLALLALAAYLGCYLPLFVALSRTALQRTRTPLWLACPIVWTGLEWVRAHLLTGFAMGALAHTQIGCLPLIQVADVGGEYGVTFLILLTAASLAGAWAPRAAAASQGARSEEQKWGFCWQALLPAGLALAGAFAYGSLRLATPHANQRELLVALIQGDSHADWKGSAEKERQIMAEHWELSREASVRAAAEFGRPPDLIVWPETMFRQPLVDVDPDDAALRAQIDDRVAGAALRGLESLVRETGAAAIVGVDRFVPHAARSGAPQAIDASASTGAIGYEIFNSSAGVDRRGRLVGTYDKRHLLPFGEYIPFVDWLPFLRDYSPITGLTQPGRAWRTFTLDGVRYAPNICYESALPHLIRRQVAELTARGERPDLLVNLTNDAWYWGSSELDMHLACGVFRAIETRTPLVAAANRGLSAAIDPYGRIVAVSRRNVPQALLARVSIGPSSANRDSATWYVAGGDWLAAICLACCIAWGALGTQRKRCTSP